MRYIILIAATLLIVVVGGAAVAVRTRMNGFSARSAPSRIERTVAGIARAYAVPPRMRDGRNPVPFSADVFEQARAHFADHCASCHANDGSGDTEMGRHMYPPVPDMRLPATQRLTDGELYWIIENGVRLTGMPAWGSGGDDEADTWKLVHLIRHLNDLTEEQLDEMKGLNPKSPSELEEERQDQLFLQGQGADDAGAAPVHHH